MKIILAGKMLKMLSLILMVTATIAINGQQWRDQEKEMIQKYDQLVKDGKMTKQEADINIERESNAIRRQAVMDIAKNNETDMHFYGKVLDQNGDPVERAVVTYSYEYYGYKKKVTWTNKEGSFEITERGMGLLMIEMIEQEGYDKSFDVNRNAKENSTPRDYDFTKQGTYHQRHDTDERFKRPDPKNPEIIRIRKKGEPVLLLANSSNFAFKKGESTKYAVNSVSTYLGMTILEEAQQKGKRIDIVLSCTYQDGAFHFIIEPQGKGAGIYVSEGKLYTAPESGYLEKYQMVIKEDGLQNKQTLYFAVKSGEPTLYSRLTIELKIYDPGTEKARLVGKYESACNPYGGTELEQAWGLDDYRQLENQAWNSLIKEKKYPFKPNFRALQEEAKKKDAK